MSLQDIPEDEFRREADRRQRIRIEAYQAQAAAEARIRDRKALTKFITELRSILGQTITDEQANSVILAVREYDDATT